MAKGFSASLAHHYEELVRQGVLDHLQPVFNAVHGETARKGKWWGLPVQVTFVPNLPVLAMDEMLWAADAIEAAKGQVQTRHLLLRDMTDAEASTGDVAWRNQRLCFFVDGTREEECAKFGRLMTTLNRLDVGFPSGTEALKHWNVFVFTTSDLAGSRLSFELYQSAARNFRVQRRDMHELGSEGLYDSIAKYLIDPMLPLTPDAGTLDALAVMVQTKRLESMLGCLRACVRASQTAAAEQVALMRLLHRDTFRGPNPLSAADADDMHSFAAARCRVLAALQSCIKIADDTRQDEMKRRALLLWRRICGACGAERQPAPALVPEATAQELVDTALEGAGVEDLQDVEGFVPPPGADPMAAAKAYLVDHLCSLNAGGAAVQKHFSTLSLNAVYGTNGLSYEFRVPGPWRLDLKTEVLWVLRDASFCIPPHALVRRLAAERERQGHGHLKDEVEGEQLEEALLELEQYQLIKREPDHGVMRRVNLVFPDRAEAARPALEPPAPRAALSDAPSAPPAVAVGRAHELLEDKAPRSLAVAARSKAQGKKIKQMMSRYAGNQAVRERRTPAGETDWKATLQTARKRPQGLRSGALPAAECKVDLTQTWVNTQEGADAPHLSPRDAIDDVPDVPTEDPLPDAPMEEQEEQEPEPEPEEPSASANNDKEEKAIEEKSSDSDSDSDEEEVDEEEAASEVVDGEISAVVMSKSRGRAEPTPTPVKRHVVVDDMAASTPAASVRMDSEQPKTVLKAALKTPAKKTLMAPPKQVAAAEKRKRGEDDEGPKRKAVKRVAESSTPSTRGEEELSVVSVQRARSGSSSIPTPVHTPHYNRDKVPDVMKPPPLEYQPGLSAEERSVSLDVIHGAFSALSDKLALKGVSKALSHHLKAAFLKVGKESADNILGQYRAAVDAGGFKKWLAWEAEATDSPNEDSWGRLSHLRWCLGSFAMDKIRTSLLQKHEMEAVDEAMHFVARNSARAVLYDPATSGNLDATMEYWDGDSVLPNSRRLNLWLKAGRDEIDQLEYYNKWCMCAKVLLDDLSTVYMGSYVKGTNETEISWSVVFERTKLLFADFADTQSSKKAFNIADIKQLYHELRPIPKWSPYAAVSLFAELLRRHLHQIAHTGNGGHFRIDQTFVSTMLYLRGGKDPDPKGTLAAAHAKKALEKYNPQNVRWAVRESIVALTPQNPEVVSRDRQQESKERSRSREEIVEKVLDLDEEDDDEEEEEDEEGEEEEEDDEGGEPAGVVVAQRAPSAVSGSARRSEDGHGAVGPQDTPRNVIVDDATDEDMGKEDMGKEGGSSA